MEADTLNDAILFNYWVEVSLDFGLYGVFPRLVSVEGKGVGIEVGCDLGIVNFMLGREEMRREKGRNISQPHPGYVSASHVPPTSLLFSITLKFRTPN